MSRESVAQRELDKAEARLRNSDLYNEMLEKGLIKGTPIAGSFKSLQEYSNLPKNVRDNFDLQYFQSKYGDRIKVPHDIAGKFGTAIEAAIGLSKGKDLDSVAIGIVVSEAVGKIGFMLYKTTPAGIIASVAISIIDESFGITDKIKKAYDDLMNNNNDLPEITINGYLKVIMPDGTVYARPFETYQGGHIIGGTKDDVLFGGDKDDKLVGGSGSDILIGGSGKDDYFVDNGDIIKDSDGKGRVFLGSSHQLTGGTQIEKGSKIYKGKDGVKYELKDNGDLLINDSITIENFSNDNLEIHLSEFDEINVTISDATAIEKNQSMNFTISLSRELKEDEFVKVSVNGKEYVFMHPSNPNYVVGTKTEYVFGSEAEYEYTWSDDSLKEEDEKFEVSATATGSDGLKVSVIKTGQGLIKDDDKDDDPDPELEASPIVIDLGNNGINSSSLNYTINFDLDNNGFKEATGWVSGDDALLAIDKNNNGIIDNGSELFGNKSISDSAFSYTNSSLNNGFETLKSYDSNNDGIIDSQDDEFDKLLLWQDKNGNAITDNGELIKLSDKVSSIDLNYTNTDINNNSNTIRQTSTATLNDGTKVKADDIWFKVNYKDTEEIIDENQIPFEIKALPNVRAFGNLHSLHYAMANNETLATMVNLYLLMDSENSKEFANLNSNNQI